jgi:S-adenosylmethionine:tRNA ribosyltransferase-isomerase
VLGAGSWRDDTDDRPRPDALAPGDRLRAKHGNLVVRGVDADGVVVEVPGGLPFLYAVGAPIQYSYADRSIGLQEVQAPFAGRPWAVEMPSAARPLRWELVLQLRRRGVAVERLTHAAGISATGDTAVDARLPFPERFEIPRRTARAVANARRVIAIGTSVVRALEGCMGAEKGVTNLVLGPEFEPAVVTGLLSGVHEPGTSHHALLEAFADPHTLARADRHAAARGYAIHEFGDSTLILPGAAASLLDGATRH